MENLPIETEERKKTFFNSELKSILTRSTISQNLALKMYCYGQTV